MVRAHHLNLATLSAVGLLVALFLVYNTVSFAVAAGRRETGILRAIGMPRASIVALYVAVAAAMGCLGGLVGTAGGAGLAQGLIGLQRRTLSDLYAALPTVADIRVDLSSEWWLQGVVIGLVVAVLGALVPSLDAARTAAARALAPGDYELVREQRTGRSAWIGSAAFGLAFLCAIPGPVSGVPLFGYAAAFLLLVGLACWAPALIGWTERLVAGATAGGKDMRGGHAALGRLALSHLSRAPGRSSVTVSALMIGVAIMVGVGTMVHSFRQTVELWINQTVVADLVLSPVAWLQGEESGISSKRIPPAWAAALRGIPEVAAVDPYRQVRADIQGRSATLVARDLLIHAERSRYLFVEGESRSILRQAAAEGGVVVSEVLARALGLERGRTVSVSTPVGPRSVPVLGVFYDYATDGGKLVMDRTLYRRYWDDDTATVLAVYLTAGGDAEVARRKIDQAIAGTAGREALYVVLGNADIKAEILRIFDRTFRITYALEGIVVVVAVLAIVNTLLTSVLERRRELATLRALGASRRQVQEIIVWESGWLAGMGTVLGLCGGGLLSLLLIGVINTQSFGWTIHYAMPGWLLVQTLGAAAVAAWVAGFVPARWVAGQSVSEGLRYE
jgi:putative ABC transport system permease protein